MRGQDGDFCLKNPFLDVFDFSCKAFSIRCLSNRNNILYTAPETNLTTFRPKFPRKFPEESSYFPPPPPKKTLSYNPKKGPYGGPGSPE